MMQKFYIILFIILLFLLWTTRLSELPGLHADEAWFGVKAYDMITSRLDGWYGMNHYTGALQSYFESLSFRGLGVGVLQLRIVGVFFNMIGISVLIRYLSINKPTIAIIFLMLFFQSAIWLVSPRIAWEVNSFNLLFISLILLSFQKIDLDKEKIPITWTGVFLFSSLLGSYNHILFSCVSLALLSSYIMMQINSKHISLSKLSLLGLNLLNQSILFGMMNFKDGLYWKSSPLFCVMFLLILINLEIILIKKIKQNIINIEFLKTHVRLKNSSFIVSISMISIFIYYHGIGFFDVLSNYKVLQLVYSYDSNLVLKILHSLIALAICLTTLYMLIVDILQKSEKQLPYLIINYLGFFCIYTVANSPRYYLILIILIFVYLSTKVMIIDQCRPKRLSTLSYLHI